MTGMFHEAIARRIRLVVCTLPIVAIATGCESAPNGPTDECARLARNPVLFVHGSGLSSAYWAEMRNALQSHGYPANYLRAVDIVPANEDNRTAAANYLAPAVDELLSLARTAPRAPGCYIKSATKVDIVAHSLGAVSSRWYAAMMAPEKIRTLISLAGADHGTYALCGKPGVGNRQACPESDDASEVLGVLNGEPGSHADETPFGIGADPATTIRRPPEADKSIVYVSLRLDDDEWILPSTSTGLAGSGGIPVAGLDTRVIQVETPGNYRIDAAVRHDDLPRNPAAIAFVLAVLAAVDEFSSNPE